MKINRSGKISIVTALDKLYSVIVNNRVDSEECINGLNIAAKLLIKLEPIFKGNLLFDSLYKNIYDLLSFLAQQTDIKIMKVQKVKVLNALEQFEFPLLEDTRFDVYLHNFKEDQIPFNTRYVQSVTDLSIDTITRKSISSSQGNQDNF